MNSSAVFSECRMFRYTLERIWNLGYPLLLVVMLNPSVADQEKNDPTITRVIKRAKASGFGGIIVCNLYAFRSPYPAKLEERWAIMAEIIGKGNDQAILESVQRCDAAFLAWGSHKLAAKRDREIIEMLREEVPLLMLEKTKDGFPKHPLHVAYARGFQPYTGRFS